MSSFCYYLAPLLREWCDMLLFANYKTVVEKAGSAPNAKNKASGGRRVLYTSHHPCWDAKNRFGLPEELPFEYASIAACIPDPHPGAAPAPRPIMAEDAPAPKPAPVPVPAAPAAPPAVPAAISASDLQAQGVPTALAQLMAANNVTPEELQTVVGQRGYFPADMPVKDYPADFVSGCLVAAWPQVLEMICTNRDVPF